MITTMIVTKVKMMMMILSDWVLQLQVEQLTKCTAKRSGKGDTVQIAFSTSIFSFSSYFPTCFSNINLFYTKCTAKRNDKGNTVQVALSIFIKYICFHSTPLFAFPSNHTKVMFFSSYNLLYFWGKIKYNLSDEEIKRHTSLLHQMWPLLMQRNPFLLRYSTLNVGWCVTLMKLMAEWYIQEFFSTAAAE